MNRYEQKEVKVNKIALIDLVRKTAANNIPFALGKIGFSEQLILNYPVQLSKNISGIQRSAFERAYRYHAEVQTGIFPSNASFLQNFSSFYSGKIRQLDVVGVFGAKQEAEILAFHSINASVVKYNDTEPDRSIPSNEALCYLPFFSGKKVLIISPYASLLKERAKKELFEKVWQKTGKQWFNPLSVEALNIPYSYGTEKQTIQNYGDSIQLHKYIIQQMTTIEYDVVLIGAGALGIPIAIEAKKQGKIALSLGGHLQVLFGVLGSRWKNDSTFMSKYINENWIDMPRKYAPIKYKQLTDSGAYW